MDDYHKSSGISKSGLDLIRKNPMEFKYVYIDGNEKKQTPQMEFGSLVHLAVLEPETFRAEISSDEELLSHGSRLTKAYKKAKEEALKEYPEMKFVRHEDFQKIINVANAVREHTLAGALLTKGEAEKVFRWNYEGIECKCKVDYIRSDNRIIDLKTTNDASNFESSILKFRYHVQAAFYRWGIIENQDRECEMIFIVVETSEPFGIRICTLENDYIHYGLQEAMEDLHDYKRFMERRHFPNYSETIEKIEYPKWRKNG